MNPSVKVARPGWDVNTAPDWALVFSSNWPSLQIAFETTITYPANEPVALSVNHNLGFVPLAMAWISVGGVNYGRIAELEVSSVYAAAFALGTYATATTITLRCFNIDITQEASYPLPVGAAGKLAPDLTTGIKIIKQNPTRSIGSKNLNDFILNSQAQSPAVLEVATEKGQYFQTGIGPGYGIVYPLSTSYIPWVVGAVSLGGGSNVPYQYYSTTALSYTESTNSLTLEFGAIGDQASLIILRDPLFYPNTVRVVY